MKTCVAACVLAAVGAHAQAEPVTQSVTAANFNSLNTWTGADLGDIPLATWTAVVSDISGALQIVDQGWGGQDPGNGVSIDLIDNGTMLWSQAVAGATHTLQTVAFDLATDNPSALTSLEGVLAGIDWSTDPTVTLSMYAHPFGWPGWELHVSNASFSATTDIPEPSSLAALGIGLAAVGLWRRRSVA